MERGVLYSAGFDHFGIPHYVLNIISYIIGVFVLRLKGRAFAGTACKMYVEGFRDWAFGAASSERCTWKGSKPVGDVIGGAEIEKVQSSSLDYASISRLF